MYSLLLPEVKDSRPITKWEVWAGGPVTASPVLYANEKLLFASHTGILYSCDAWDKAFNWRFSTGGPITGPPAVDPSGVYVASMDRSLYKVDPVTGFKIWRQRFPCQLIEGPVVAAHIVYQYCESAGLTAVDADLGQQKWRLPAARAFIAHARGRDVLLTKDKRVLVADRDSGKVLHTIETTSVKAAVTNTRNEAVYLLGNDGRVLCAKPVSAPYLRHQEVTAAQEKLNVRPAAGAGARRGTGINAPEEAEPVVDDPLRSRHDRRP
jgi:outer membrane protein assembly factor BamB